MSGINAEHLVFLDESGINTNLTRLYAHALHWKRAVDAAPLNTPTATTVLSSIRLDGTTIFTTYQGGTTAARFREYIENQLVPSLKKEDLVVMDNMRSHHAKAGIHYAYLPPYSPDLNPIEKMWSKMKAILRKQKVRVASELPEAVKKALEMIKATAKSNPPGFPVLVLILNQFWCKLQML